MNKTDQEPETIVKTTRAPKNMRTEEELFGFTTAYKTMSKFDAFSFIKDNLPRLRKSAENGLIKAKKYATLITEYEAIGKEIFPD